MDFKKYTSSAIYKAIEGNCKESRKKWLLWLLKKENRVWFWEKGHHGKEIVSGDFLRTKVNYIKLNPVRAGVVLQEEEYKHSSCVEIYGVGKSALELAKL
jgi:putative transposase